MRLLVVPAHLVREFLAVKGVQQAITYGLAARLAHLLAVISR